MLLALEHSEDDPKVRSCVNSYISHMRSVTFVMQKESAQYPELLKWYNATMEKMKGAPLLKFFNEKRVHSIHRGVVKLEKTSTTIYNVVVNGVELPGSGTATSLQFNGIQEYMPHDSGNVFRLCEEYYKVMKWMVQEWLRQRRLLGIESPPPC